MAGGGAPKGQLNMLTSVISEGFAGMQQSQKKMQQAAQDLVSAGVPRDNSVPSPVATGAAPASDAGTAVPGLPAAQAVEAGSSITGGASAYRSQADLVEPLLEQKQQQLLFDASASVVKTGSETLGSLIDDLS